MQMVFTDGVIRTDWHLLVLNDQSFMNIFLIERLLPSNSFGHVRQQSKSALIYDA